MKISTLTQLGLFLNGAAGNDKYDLSIDRVRREIGRGTIFAYLKAELGDDINLGLPEPAEQQALLDEWSGLANAYTSEELCVNDQARNGLTLLVAFVLLGIQSRRTDCFLIDDEQRQALQDIQAREGIFEHAQIRCAIGEWLERRQGAPIEPATEAERTHGEGSCRTKKSGCHHRERGGGPGVLGNLRRSAGSGDGVLRHM